MKIGFALLLDDDTQLKLIGLQNEYADEYGLPRLSDRINLPHTTLLQGEFADDFDFKRVFEKLYREAVRYKLDSICLSSVEYTPVGWYFLKEEKRVNLVGLHDFLFDVVKDDMIGRPDAENLEELSDGQYFHLLKYGYRYIGADFTPHVTLFRLGEKEDTAVLEKLKESFSPLMGEHRVKALSVYEMGVNGMHAKTLLSKELPIAY